MKSNKILVFFTLFVIGISEPFAGETQAIAELYKAGQYDRVCREGMQRYYRGDKEAHFAAMVGMACARVDTINPLGILQRNLVSTPALRSSAIYFSTLVLAKRLLYHHFVDGIPLGGFALPQYDHILSIVFDHVRRGDVVQMGDGMVRIDHGSRRILVSVSDDEPPRLLVDEYNGAQLVGRHWYQ